MVQIFPNVHLCGFSPECVFLWVCRWLDLVVLYSHWLHWCSFSPMCCMICVLREEAVLHEKLHCVHLCGFSPLWMREWVFKVSSLLNDLLHCGQLYLTPLWVCLWLKRLPLLANVFGHTSQDNCFGILNYQLFSRPAISFDCLWLQQPTTFPLFLGWEKKTFPFSRFDFKIQDSQKIDPIDELNHIT